MFYSIFRLLHILHLFKNYRLSHNPHFIGIFQICQLNLCATCVLHVCYRKKFTKIFKNSKKRRYKKIPKTQGFEDFCKCFLKRVIISLRTEVRVLLLSDPVSFFLSYEGLLSGSLLFSEKVCSHHLPEAVLWRYRV